MGFAVYYRSTRPVTQPEADTICAAALAAIKGRTWLGCEPVSLSRDTEDGHLSGGSKPNFMPHPDDAAAAACSDLPNGTTRDVINILCQLSRDHGVDWEVDHDDSDGPIGYIRDGLCDDEVFVQIDAFDELGDILREFEDGPM